MNLFPVLRSVPHNANAQGKTLPFPDSTPRERDLVHLDLHMAVWLIEKILDRGGRHGNQLR